MGSRVGFIFLTTIFFLFIVNVSAMIGANVIDGFTVDNSIDLTGVTVLDFLIGIINNIGIFVTLTFTTSSFGLFGTVIIVSYSLAMIVLILEMLRGN